MATALNYERDERKRVNAQAAKVIKEERYRDVNNWSPAHIYHEISGYTKLSDINKKGNLSSSIAFINRQLVNILMRLR